MKITFLHALLIAVCSVAATAKKTEAQQILNREVSVKFSNTNLRMALVEIEKQAHVRFVYSTNFIQSDKTVNLQASHQTLASVLSKLLLPNQITYEVVEEQIVLKRTKENVSLLAAPGQETSNSAAAAAAAAAEDKVSGAVKTDRGEGIPGVSILVKGTTRGTVSDPDGRFSITAQRGNVLVFSFIGFTTKEVTVQDQTTFDVQLSEAATSLSEVAVVGTRGLPRTDVDRPVPVDVISAKELQSTGQIELSQMVQFSSPSFNSAKTAVNGVANYADPASLRGLSPDQMLVLVDGKRRHQFSGLNLNVTVGLGTVVTDMNSIPSLAVDRIEVLRDGAAAQYGSDAIAGIVNMGLNRSVGKLTFKTQYGVTKMGDGASSLGAFNYGFKLGKPNSYLNVSLQYQHSDATDRSDNYIPRPVTGGAYTGIYSNTPATDETTRASRGVWPAYGTFKVGQYGSNKTTAYQAFYNLGMPLAKNWTLYSFGGVSLKDVQAFGFFRVATPTNVNSTPELFPDGYTPELPGRNEDYSTVIGVNRKVLNGWNLDISTGYGFNSLDLQANNTTNPSMGAASPKNFFVGRSAFGQSATELNMSRNFKGFMNTKSFNLALGAQYRVDNFILKRGSPESYFVGPLALSRSKAPGSSGRPGIAPEDETDTKRSNIGVYADVETDITDRFLVAGAVRFENYSDFGSNVSGKLAMRYKITNGFSVRASINRGFRAPSLAQTFNSVTTSTVQAGAIIQTKQLPNNNPNLAKIGIEQPTAETSLNYNVGVTAQAGSDFLFTLDAYQIDIKDRIILSERFIVNNIAALRPLFPGISEIRFFTNHVGTTTKGIDFVTTYKHSFSSRSRLNLSLALTLNQTRVTSQRATPSLLQAGTTAKILVIDTVSIGLIETAQPRQKAHLNVGYQLGKVSLNWRVSYFGGVTAWEKPVNRPHITQDFSAKTLHDVSISYAPSSKFTFTIGANNVTDVYPDRVALNFAGYSNGQIPYSRNVNQFGFNGAYYFGSLSLTL